MRIPRREFKLLHAGGNGTANLRHGIVTEHLGCGYYLVELSDWVGNMSQSGIGIGSGWSGSGSTVGSGVVDMDCNVCADIVGEGTASCELILSYPQSQLAGTGAYVTAHHHASLLIPLVIPSDCILVNLGDVDGGNTSAGNTSGSGSGDTPERIWHILDGLQEHIVEYREEWDCCEPDGPFTLIRKHPKVLIGMSCPPIECGACPGSGSASGS